MTIFYFRHSIIFITEFCENLGNKNICTNGKQKIVYNEIHLREQNIK